jgi:hypothetical protein
MGVTLYQPAPDDALRARYASAVRTLRRLRKLAIHDRDTEGLEIIDATLIQLGEPIEPEGM